MDQQRSKHTYSDYLNWPENPRKELIRGEACPMPSPSIVHQRVVGRIFVQLSEYLRHLGAKPCEAFMAPFDVRLFWQGGDEDDDDTVVQPDLIAVCDKRKLEDGKSCKGAPEVVFEVVSPESSGHDCISKRDLYEKAGVSECWLVLLGEKREYVIDFDGNVTRMYNETEQAPSAFLAGFALDLDRLFSE